LKINSVEVMLGSMEQGAWYGRTDMQHMSGLKRGTVATAILRAESLGLLRRIKNPEWERQGGAECEFLYQKLSHAQNGD
jgi:predicted transcriptional regulator